MKQHRKERELCTAQFKPFDSVGVYMYCALHVGHTGNHKCPVEWNEKGELQ